MIGSAASALVSAGLSAALLAMYVRSYRRVRAAFTLGLIVFAGFFTALNALAAYASIIWMELVPPFLAPYLLGILLLEGIGLSFLVWTTAT